MRVRSIFFSLFLLGVTGCDIYMPEPDGCTYILTYTENASGQEVVEEVKTGEYFVRDTEALCLQENTGLIASGATDAYYCKAVC